MLKKILIGIVIGIFVLALLKDFLIKTAVVTVGSKVVGAPIEMQSCGFGLLTQEIRIKGFKLYNPPGFPKEPMVDLPEVFVKYDLGALLKGKLYLPFVVVNLKEMVVVKNKEGQLNVDSLPIVKATKKGQSSQPKDDGVKGERKSKPAAAAPALQIDELKLNIDQVVYKDYARGEPPVVQAYDVGLRDKTFKDIKSVQELVVLILVQGMGPAAIKGAGIYAAASFLGVAFLPAGVAAAIVGKDSASAEFKFAYEKVYQTSLDVVKQGGEIKSESRDGGIIKAKVGGADVTLKFEKLSGGRVRVTASARQLFLPKPETAQGVIYQLEGKLK